MASMFPGRADLAWGFLRAGPGRKFVQTDQAISNTALGAHACAYAGKWTQARVKFDFEPFYSHNITRIFTFEYLNKKSTRKSLSTTSKLAASLGSILLGLRSSEQKSKWDWINQVERLAINFISTRGFTFFKWCHTIPSFLQNNVLESLWVVLRWSLFHCVFHGQFWLQKKFQLNR